MDSSHNIQIAPEATPNKDSAAMRLCLKRISEHPDRLKKDATGALLQSRAHFKRRYRRTAPLGGKDECRSSGCQWRAPGWHRESEYIWPRGFLSSIFEDEAVLRFHDFPGHSR